MKEEIDPCPNPRMRAFQSQQTCMHADFSLFLETGSTVAFCFQNQLTSWLETT